MRELADGVADIPLEYVRVFVLEDKPPGTTTLVDTGFERTADYLVDTLRETIGDVDRVILTHDGGDHYGGLDAVMDAFDPQLCAAPAETELMATIDHEPDVAIEHGDVLEGDIEVIQVPGHSVCPSALLLHDVGALISADVLDGADRRGLPEGYLLPPPETFNHDHQAAERNLERLLEYEFDSVFVFHGSHVHEGAKDKLDRFLEFKAHYRQDQLDAWDATDA
jgi:glyoxylase-like metal-dependent hydrolase (beta-lactamase superfamily II)